MYNFKEIARWWVKKSVRQAVLKYRKFSWRDRCLPNFIIIGAMKSGTTSLHRYLNQHPQIIQCYKKEIQFFDGGRIPSVDNFKEGMAWYRAHFPLNQTIGSNQKTFEASPSYIFNPLAPKRIAELVPGVKIIAVLRNPTERAISHYFHERRKRREWLPIMEAMLAEEERLKPVIAKEDYKNNIFLHHSYKSRGLYCEQIKRYLNYFPMKNILIIDSESFLKDTDITLRRVFQFVEIDSEIKIKTVKPYNVATNRVKVDTAVYEYLNNYFYPHNQTFYELMGENYGW